MPAKTATMISAALVMMPAVEKPVDTASIMP